MTRTGVATVLAAALAGVMPVYALPVQVQPVQVQPGAQTRPVPQAVERVAESGRIDAGGSGESLSSKLDRTGGVIAPKEDVDPAIRVPAPEPRPNSTPVIPPSQNGGGTAK